MSSCHSFKEISSRSSRHCGFCGGDRVHEGIAQFPLLMAWGCDRARLWSDGENFEGIDSRAVSFPVIRFDPVGTSGGFCTVIHSLSTTGDEGTISDIAGTMAIPLVQEIH